MPGGEGADDRGMDITIVHVADCPHVTLARQRIDEALEQLGLSATLHEQLVTSEHDALDRLAQRRAHQLRQPGADQTVRALRSSPEPRASHPASSKPSNTQHRPPVASKVSSSSRSPSS